MQACKLFDFFQKLNVTSDILTILIRNQKSAIRYLTLFAVSIVVIGIALIFYSFIFIESSGISDTIKLFLGVGGGFISTISAFPINQIIIRIEKMRLYQYYDSNMDKMTKNDIKKVEDLITKSIDKIF
jgi:hypothetical protein